MKNVITILFFSADYAVARKKLKQAEDLSDLNSCTEHEEYLKKSRKIRAAKIYDSSSEDDEQSDDSTILSLPKPPNCQTDITRGPLKRKASQISTGKITIKHSHIKKDTINYRYLKNHMICRSKVP